MPATHSVAATQSPFGHREIDTLLTRGASPALQRRSGLTQASLIDTLAVLLQVMLPTFAKGVIIRRPHMTAMAERLDLDRRAVRRLQRLRAKHGTAPLMLRLPVRNQAVILDPAHVHRILQETPSPFSPASSEKRAALSHFQPKSSLISKGAERTIRRQFNEDVLGHTCPVHQMAQRFLALVDEEASQLHALARRQDGVLAWPDLGQVWGRLVRRVIFGDSASQDQEVSDLMTRLRHQANWAFMLPQRTGLRDQLHARLRMYLERAEEGSLAALIAQMPTASQASPEQQIPQWLFAFDPAGMTMARTLALLATHPAALQEARDEVRSADRAELPYLRACALEALRLWPTTPAVLRQTTQDTEWGDGAVMPAGTGVLIYAPFFHRDDEALPFAHRLTPDLWLRERTTNDWPLIPFSEGSGVCPGRHLVLLLVSAMVGALIERGPVSLASPTRLHESRPLPGTLSHFGLKFKLNAG